MCQGENQKTSRTQGTDGLTVELSGSTKTTTQPDGDTDKKTDHLELDESESHSQYKKLYVDTLNEKTKTLLQIKFSSIDQAALCNVSHAQVIFLRL